MVNSIPAMYIGVCQVRPALLIPATSEQQKVPHPTASKSSFQTPPRPSSMTSKSSQDSVFLHKGTKSRYVGTYVRMYVYAIVNSVP